MEAPREVDEREYCKLCKMWFSDWDAFTIHKIQSKEHIACYVCGRDFKSQEGCTRHQRQEHAAEQSLSCVGCGEKFNRAGAYISHIEFQHCKAIHKEDFDRRRDEKEHWHKTTKPSDGEKETHTPKENDLPVKVNEDSWETWNIVTGPTFDKAKDFPVLPTTEYRNGGSMVEDLLTGAPDDADMTKFKWTNGGDRGKALFPNAPGAVKPPAELLATLSVKKDVKNLDDGLPPEYDPDHPEFDPSKLYNPYSKKYRCPWHDCKKLQTHIKGLKQHLKSPAHMNERLRCPACLRIFKSATALVQHAESQSYKCDIRESEKYRQAVDQITGGFIDAVGKHADNTVKYIAPQDVKLSRVKEAEESYWTKREAERQELLAKQKERIGEIKW